MNLEASTNPQAITEIAAPEQLIAAREARGWSMSDVASKLGMMPRQIDAIEQGRWDALPGHAFVRGAIRAYGKALQVDVAPLLATLGSQTNVPELRPSSSLDSPLPRHGALGFDNGGSGSRIVWIVLGVIGVIAIAMYFGRGADFGRVLEPGSDAQPGRAVDVVPVAPGSSGSDESAAARGAAPAGAGAPGGTAVSAGPAASGGSGASGSGAAGTGAAATGGAASSGVTGAVQSGAASAGNAADALGAGAASATTPSTTTPFTTTPAATTPAATTPSASAAPSGSGSAASPPSGASSTPGTTAASDAVGSAASATGTHAAGSTASAAPSPAAPSASVGAAVGTPAAAAQHAGDGVAKGASDAARAADSLVLRFVRESWVEVRDATGRTLLIGTQPADSVREVSGQKPYSMTIGNAPFVRVEHGGRNVDLGAVTQKGVARVRVE